MSRDPVEYYRRYFLNLELEIPEYMKVGKIFHSIPLENWEAQLEEEGLQAYHKTFKKFQQLAYLPNQETEFNVIYHSKLGSVEIVGFFDGYDENTIYEIKTSPARLWTPDKLKEHGQFKLYALVFYHLFGHLPNIEVRSVLLREDPNKSRIKVLRYVPQLSEVLTIQTYIEETLEKIKQLAEAHNENQD